MLVRFALQLMFSSRTAPMSMQQHHASSLCCACTLLSLQLQPLQQIWGQSSQHHALQAAGRSLLGLRCDDATTGFLGKTLLTFVRNKGPAGASSGEPGQESLRSATNPLPAHKFSPHDVVAVRPNAAQKGGAGAGAEGGDAEVAQGVVYRVYDDKIVVAVDELAESASLDVPLRLDKLANKVHPPHACCGS